MTIPNRITLDDLAGMEIGVIAALPAAELALLADEARDELDRAKRLKDWVDGAIDIKYGARAAGVRHAAGKDTGTVRFEDGGVTVVADLPKRVQWDQARLAAIVAEIRAAGDDPAEYVTTEFKVSERAYGAWPSSIRSAFEPARTVTAGKSIYQFISTEEK
ncbi:hypothetical protein [Magnetospirillum sp. UT-4]|uniref:hypothetical protein n=1 Tax=Magnetospirillum sp. UT-4 TaxID=2681467 RepID=UPI001380D34F|nr:hypothetical protein [Magnetospirillum sp. UT-4]CAA7615772.1 conserved hypothetical protein [Magnetospirillum sp. UT-4]